MVKLTGAPVQPLAEGVTVIVAVTGVLVLLVAVKEAMLPLPLAASPMEGVLFAHAKVVPATSPVKVTNAVAAVLQTTWSTGASTVGVGFTVIVNVSGVPTQPFAEGVTVMVATTGALVALVAEKEGRLPVPLAARPMEAMSFDQL
jgi:hypothetical protein